ncbi:hypothetical protein GGI15_001997 [Coemansia interrupta]|uniref:Uncharacterized protein n=1 Tax=Coemansia interrupta TaxID=1126814 RepID=A0A9W8HG70_9FUNG|nr:hypothetical protein GGI15_001997 [Coemansia interrupta]
MRVDMGDKQPREACSRRITGDTQFMFQFYKPCIQFYAPSGQTSTCMQQERLQASLVVALHSCPLLFGRFVIQKDLSVELAYDPRAPNSPTIEFQHVAVTYGELAAGGFAYSLARTHGLDMDIPDGAIVRGFDRPMLMLKVSFLGDGGVAVFNMSNHVAFDGNAIFSFLAHWARCNAQRQSPQPAELPDELQLYATSLVPHTGRQPLEGPREISVDASMTPAELSEHTAKLVSPADVCAGVFEISLASLADMKRAVAESGVLGAGEWVSSAAVLTAFVAQCVARANTAGQTYEYGGWTVFQTLDMRRPLGLAQRGLGSPLMLAELQVGPETLMDPAQLPTLARDVRRSVGRYSAEYLQDAMDWMHATYGRLAQSGVDQPWRHFWFSALNTNRRTVGVSCMDRIPVYEADFGAGRPRMARSFNPRPNYVIVFPGPPPPPQDTTGGTLAAHTALHLYVTLERPAMRELRRDSQWAARCTLISDF